VHVRAIGPAKRWPLFPKFTDMVDREESCLKNSETGGKRASHHFMKKEE
jgi:hypothetical protein